MTLFVLAYAMWPVITETHGIICIVCYKPTAVGAPRKKLVVSWQFLETYGAANYGSGWRKDVVNRCVEFAKP